VTMADATVDNKRILIIAGDFEVIQNTREALQNKGFDIQAAYSHRDSLYTLEQGKFDVAVVDAAMFDRRSGEYTAVALARLYGTLPLVFLASNGYNADDMFLPSNAVLTPLDSIAILHRVSAVLGIATAGTDDLSKKTATQEPSSKRDEEVETLFALSKSLTEVLDLSEVLNRVVEAARRLTDAEEGMILLPDDDAGQLYLRAKVGIDVKVAQNFRIKTKDTLAGHVFSRGETVLIGEQGPLKVKTEYLVNALLYVPIVLQGTTIGVLGVNNRSTHDVFNEKHQELLLNLASLAAIAIENARVHEESLQRARELEVLVEASHVVNSSLSMDRTLPNICEQLVRCLNVSWSEICEWRQESQQLRTLARYYRTVWRTGQGPTITLSQRPVMQAALDKNQSFQVTRDVPLSPDALEQMKHAGVGAILTVPISAGDQILGAVQAYYIYMPEKQVGADVLQRVQHLALEGLVDILNNASQPHSQGIFRRGDNINRALESDWCELSLLSPDKQALVVHVAVGKGVWLSPPQPFIELAQYPEILKALETQEPVNERATNGSQENEVGTLPDAIYSRALLGLPLVQRGQTHGLVLFADTQRNRVYSQREIDMGRAIVGQAATALENARLVLDLEGKVQALKDAQDRLVRSARLTAMGELAAAVAHQINNPLAAIMMDTEMMLQDESPDSPNYASLQTISRAGRRASSVARRLLAIARPGDPDAPTIPIDVLDTIEGVLSLVKAHVERDRIQIYPKLPAEKLPPVWAGPGQLDDIWLNLLMNAHDALVGHEGAKIGIEARHSPSDDYIEVVVWDNGPGIPEKIKAEIFEPFFTTKPVGEGTGLGLHICRQVVERVGGSISIDSQYNDGTRFIVRLPIKRGAES
jgi:signal transduction histidine kinase/DNA-binding response OmpR family regulator